MRKTYEKAVAIRNKAARENGYNDLNEYWIENFEDVYFEKNFDALMEEILPIYQQLHKYVRRKLDAVYEKNYPKNHNPKLIPAHILGN
jgi:peptidyl-dipeptidase A